VTGGLNNSHWWNIAVDLTPSPPGYDLFGALISLVNKQRKLFLKLLDIKL
jgi:hypothetical protein